MSINYAIVGGDRRIIELDKILAKEGNKVYVYGQEKETSLLNIPNIIICDALDETIKNSKIIIGPIPFSSNGIDINTPFSDEVISIQELCSKINNKLFIVCKKKNLLF